MKCVCMRVVLSIFFFFSYGFASAHVIGKSLGQGEAAICLWPFQGRQLAEARQGKFTSLHTQTHTHTFVLFFFQILTQPLTMRSQQNQQPTQNEQSPAMTRTPQAKPSPRTPMSDIVQTVLGALLHGVSLEAVCSYA